jgi:hypothetical protein
MEGAPSSSAALVPYHLREAKQAERRLLLDLLKTAGDCGLTIANYRYIGMGANRFYDFLLVHRYLGVSKMISLEHNPDMFERAKFSVPFGFIDVRKTASSRFIAGEPLTEPFIIWLDYDGSIDRETTQDITALATKAKAGDFCFVTVPARPTRPQGEMSLDERLAWFNDEFGDAAINVVRGDVERSSFATAVHKVLITAYRSAFAGKRECTFVPFVQVLYKDTAPMMTVGGGLLPNAMVDTFRERANALFPFLSTEEAKLYEIRPFNLTERERSLFDLATTRAQMSEVERKRLTQLGFGDDDIRTYRELIRYLPRYVETIV